MTRPLLFCFAFLGFSSLAWGTVEPGQILPANVEYDPGITTPEEFFGFQVGARHLYHHELVGYCRRLSRESERVSLVEYGRSHGGRELLLLFISSPDNQRELESIRAKREALCDPARARQVEIESLPAVINMGYSVHGNEPSASNAAALVAYYLAAALGEDHERLLTETIVSLDPCLNPDGFERFAHWANNHRGQVNNPDPNHLEHQEPAPSGRTNYYWFDLNRDWLPAQHPETQGRLEMFYKWRPNVVLDFHEMGTNATYFFQPGVAKRNHPMTPPQAIKLTQEFGRYHAAALDRIGSLYFTEERFDDFYIGKGSTYPDLHGAIGILFEQASARGHLQQSVNGPLSFPFAIRNHFVTSMSSLQATRDHRQELLEHQRTFYEDSVALARNNKIQGYLVKATGDSARLRHFLEVLDRHRIHAFELASDWAADGTHFPKVTSFIIPANQPEHRFLQAVFESRTEFEESIFYDVSTWTLPLAFNLAYAPVTEAIEEDRLGRRFSRELATTEPTAVPADALAFVVDWRGYYAPKLLYRLLAAEVLVKVSTESFRVDSDQAGHTFQPGTLLVPLGVQPLRRKEISQILEASRQDGVSVTAAETGLTPSGIDFGSSALHRVTLPKVLLVVGSGASSYEAGEVWHLLDRRLEMPVTLTKGHAFEQLGLKDYSTVVFVSGSHSTITAQGVENLKRFVADGGTLVAMGSAIQWVDRQKLIRVQFRSPPVKARSPVVRHRYADADRDAALQLVRGSIFGTQVDASHPIGYGFTAEHDLPVFRNNNVFLEPAKNPYSTPVAYRTQPLLSGYVSTENLALLSGSASVVVESLGKGRIVLFAENPNFRGFWFGTNRLFLNALFFGSLIRSP